MTTLSLSYDKSKELINLIIDSDGPVNTIDNRFMQSFGTVLGMLGDYEAAGIVISSNKKGSFITGADLMELFGGGPEAVETALKKMNGLLGSLSRVGIPVVAVLNDQAAVGGGFEFLLRCCDHIIATHRSSYGLPEVHFGLVSALGGTYHLARVAGLEMGLNLVTRGRTLRTQELAAVKIATACRAEELEDKAADYIKRNREKQMRVIQPFELPVHPEDPSARNDILTGYMERAEVSPQRPWLKSAVNLFELSLELDFDSFAIENIEEFCGISEHPNTKNKIDFYFMKTFMFPRAVKIDTKKAVKCDAIGVVGSGMMGSGIAQVAADNGIKVRIMDVDEKIAQAAIESMRKVLGGLVKKGRWTEKRLERCIENISVVKSLDDMKKASLIIEAIPEKMELKQKLAGEVHGMNENIIFATNTSSLPIGDISKGTGRPDRVVGMHYFSPVPLMELLEVIEGDESSQETVAAAMLLGKSMGKTCILVGDGPGFYTSRVFSGFLYGGFLSVEAGADPWEVDKIAVRAGFPRGPLHMFCSVGGMIPYHAGKFMETRAPERLPVPACMVRVAEAGYVGSGGDKGFYKDEAGRIPDESILDHIVRKQGLPKPAPEDVEDILLLGMVNEAFWVMGEGILRDYPSMDIGAVLGVGFPDCFHGPARYAGMRGLPNVISRLEELHEKFRIPHLGPAPELKRLVACGVRNNLI